MGAVGIPKVNDVRDLEVVGDDTPEHKVEHDNAKVNEDLTKYVNVKNVHWRISSKSKSTDFVKFTNVLRYLQKHNSKNNVWYLL